MRKRTKARELALQGAYQLDVRGGEVLADIEGQIRELAGDPEVEGFALELLRGAWDRRADLDRAIERVAKNWEIRRMAVIDRNILRLGAYELLFRDDIPPLVTINEAIEIAKKYSTRKSGHFVNGILDQIRANEAPEGKRRGGDAPPPSPPESEE